MPTEDQEQPGRVMPFDDVGHVEQAVAKYQPNPYVQGAILALVAAIISRAIGLPFWAAAAVVAVYQALLIIRYKIRYRMR